MKRLYVVAILILNLFSFTYGQGNLDYRPLESVGEIPAEFRSMTANKVRKAQIEEDHSDRTIREQRTVNDFLLRNNYFVDELLNSGKVLFGDPLSQYVNDVAHKLLIQDEALKSKLRFYILKSDEVNAFATNVGVIFITVGLLAKIENEAQLAFVLAHEIAHVEKFHSIESVLAADKLLNGNRRDYSNYQSKIRVLSSFSREKEFEADSVGFFRYIKSGYSPEASSQMMDVLRENEMPLYEFAFDPSFLEIDQMQFPKEFVTFDIKQLPAANDSLDDSESTHPNIAKRKENLSRFRSGVSADGHFFSNEKNAFMEMQHKARLEYLHLQLLSASYVDAFYNAWSMKADFPDDVKYLEEAMGRSLYGLSKYRDTGSEERVFYDTEDIYGEITKCNGMFLQLKKDQLYLISIRYLIQLENKYHSPFITRLLNDLIDSSVDSEIFKYDNIITGMADAAELRAKLANKSQSVEDGMPLQIDSNQEKVQEKTEQEEENSDQGIYEVLNIGDSQDGLSSENEVETDSAKYANAFHYLAFTSCDTLALKNRILERKNLIESRAKRKQEYEQEIMAHSRKYLHKGYSLDLDKVVFVDPAFYDFDRSRGVELVDSEIQLMEFKESIRECAELAGLQSEVLNTKEMSISDIQRYNNLAKLNDWIAERMMQDNDRIKMIPLQTEFTEAVCDEFGTDYFCYTGAITTKFKRQNAFRFMTISLLFWPIAPFVWITALTPLRVTYVYSFMYNMRTGEDKWIYDQTITRKASSGFLKSLLYDSFYQMKRSEQ